MAHWSVSDIPRQTGRSILITGTGGIGYQAALVLAKAGAEVIFASRDASKGAQAITRIRATHPSALVSFELVDLADLTSIRRCGQRLRAQRASLDVLINNAGVMTPPQRRQTADGFELQFGTNYLGAFALTRELMPLLMRGNQPRVIMLSSLAARRAEINFDDLQSQRSYKPFVAYSQSKLADLLFALELQRRSEAHGWGLTSIAVHPGLVSTPLFTASANPKSLLTRFNHVTIPLYMQPVARGAWPLLFAATSPQAKGGAYYGPNGFHELRGYPAAAKIPKQAGDLDVAKRLWEVSERLTGERF